MLPEVVLGKKHASVSRALGMYVEARLGSSYYCSKYPATSIADCSVLSARCTQQGVRALGLLSRSGG